jgi:hypothetical protein
LIESGPMVKFTCHSSPLASRNKAPGVLEKPSRRVEMFERAARPDLLKHVMVRPN